MRILKHQVAAVQVIELGRMVDLLRPEQALQLLQSHPTAVCFGRGSAEGIKFITIQVDADLQAAMNEDQARKLPEVHATPQHHVLGWSQQPRRARTGIMGGLRQRSRTLHVPKT